MTMRDGEVYVCSNEKCGCEIRVTKGVPPAVTADLLPRCCCGAPMRRQEPPRLANVK